MIDTTTLDSTTNQPSTEEVAQALEAVIPRYMQALRRAIERAEGPDRLTINQVRCLQKIDASPNGESLTSILARQLGVSAPSMSSMIDGLVERGLVMRLPDRENRRQIRLRMTDEGKTLLARYESVIATHLLGLLTPLGVRSKRRVFNAMNDLGAALDEADAAEPRAED